MTDRERTEGDPAPARQSVGTRCGVVALVGAPNAGKSTLVNALVGGKVSIVSRKVQTTRTQIRGIAVEGETQVVLVDTPGLFRPRRRLDRAMVESARLGAADADAVGVLVDVRKADAPETEEAMAAVEHSARRGALRFLVLNKVDTIDKAALIPIAQTLNAGRDFAATFMVAALTSYGTADILRWLASRMPPGPWLYPADQMSDAPLRFLAAEITREQIYERLHDELPYQSTVETDRWETRKDGSVRIDQTIYVEREGQRKIVLGEGGSTIRTIGQRARAEIAEATGTPVHLFLHVKVREDWEDDPERYREMGLEFPRDPKG